MTRTYKVTFRKKIRETGEKQYINLPIGRAYEGEDGHINVVINSIPINFDGKIRLWVNNDNYQQEEKEED